jgi:hypothetical protein
MIGIWVIIPKLITIAGATVHVQSASHLAALRDPLFIYLTALSHSAQFKATPQHADHVPS